jgi:hypothetical protein
VDLGVLLELARRAELSVHDLALLTKARLTSEPLSAGTNPVPGQGQAGVATKGLSPIAAKVPSAQRGVTSRQAEGHGSAASGGLLQKATTVSPGMPESSSMAAARTGASLNPGGSRALWGSGDGHTEEQALATSRDAEVAMELVAREALEKIVDREDGCHSSAKARVGGSGGRGRNPGGKGQGQGGRI